MRHQRTNGDGRSLTDRFRSDVTGIGASAAVVSDPSRALRSPNDLALLQVLDTLNALHKLAPNYRQLMPQRSMTVSNFTQQNHPPYDHVPHSRGEL